MNNGNDEFMERDQDQGILYIPAERRNVNGRFPIGREFGSYRKLTKRYPVAKRSPRPTQTKLKTTDPKVMRQTTGHHYLRLIILRNHLLSVVSH